MNALQIVTRKIEPIMEVQTRTIDYMTRYMVSKGFK
ncbi:asparagine synthetase, partial [Thermococcus sp. GR7]|nr:asparagine synthetase [Thermococcus sp. GR7]